MKPAVNAGILVVGALLLAACATHVSSKTKPAELSDGPVGFVAFRYDTESGESAQILVKHVQTGKSYTFNLNHSRSSVYAFVGPFEVYRKQLGGAERPALTLIPLPAGDYTCRRLYVSVPNPAWLGFLMQQSNSLTSHPMNNDGFSVAAEKATYIGTYRASAQARLFRSPLYSVETINDGRERAAAVGIQDNYSETLVDIR